MCDPRCDSLVRDKTELVFFSHDLPSRRRQVQLVLLVGRFNNCLQGSLLYVTFCMCGMLYPFGVDTLKQQARDTTEKYGNLTGSAINELKDVCRVFSPK